MKKTKSLKSLIFIPCFIFVFYVSSFGEDSPPAPEAQSHSEAQQVALVDTRAPASEPMADVSQEQPAPAEDEAPASSLAASENVTLDFKEADIQNVLKIIAYKSGINIVTTPDVIGNVSIRLVDVPWEGALDIMLKTYGFGYQRQGNVILVTKLENISKIQAEESPQTEIVTLKFLDAQDAQKILIPLLSPRGRISILYTRGQKGWQFGTFKIGKELVSGHGLVKEVDGQLKAETISIEKTLAGDTISRKAEFEPSIKSKTLIITDTAASLDRIRNVILPLVDKKPKQVLIETRLIEVNTDKLRDLGVDWGIGAIGNATNKEVTTGTLSRRADGTISSKFGGHSLGSEFKPSVFNAKEGAALVSGIEPFNLGGQLVFQKLTGTKLEAVLHALEEDVDTNTLSAPRILTLDNQEAAILVGFHTPILASTVTAGDLSGQGATVTQTLDYYQEIGIRLNVVPQINEEGYINMIIHPSVTSTSSSVTATSTAGATTTSTSYPIIDVREAQTQILIKDGETIVLGGLLKDVKGKETIGIPFLSKIPFFGGLFRRDTYDTEKVDLLIFITARILKEGELSPAELARLEQSLSNVSKVTVPEKEKKLKKRLKK